MRNTSGLKRSAGPGRPRGAKNKIPGSFKASFQQVYEQIATDDPNIIKNAILRGLRGKPREAFPFVQLGAYYIDGKPKESIEHSGDLAMVPAIVNVFTDGKSAKKA